MKNSFLKLYLLCYGIASGLFLTRFPYVHSDESWLAWLSRDMMQARSLAVTESFFNAKERYPHAIKSLYHLLQQGFIAAFGFTPAAVRLLSLSCALGFLYLFYYLLRHYGATERSAIFITILFSLDPWFIYLSHFARQEIFILLFMAAALYAARRPLIAALFTGIAIGFHPNSFLIATCVTPVIAYEAFRQAKEGTARAILRYVIPTGAFALIYVAISNSFRPQFLKNYFAYGAADFGLDAAPGKRLEGLLTFFARITQGVSGTYYLPFSRLHIAALIALILVTLYRAIVLRKREGWRWLIALLGLTAGMFIVARYNPLSFLFYLLFGYLLLATCLSGDAFGKIFSGRRAVHAALAGLVLMAALTLSEVTPWLQAGTYDAYLQKLAQYVPAGEKTLASLNTGFYFDAGRLYDLRNLPYVVLDADGRAPDEAERVKRLRDYLKENDVRYIVYPHELDFLYEHRPYYNVIYGNVMFIPALKALCETECERVGSFTDLTYGVRVSNIFGLAPYTEVSVYALD